MRSYCFQRIGPPSRLQRCALWGLLSICIACSEQRAREATGSAAGSDAARTQVQVPSLAFSPADPDSGVDWRSWGASAFEEAHRTQRPVLLYTSRPGCDGLFSGDDPLARWQAQTRFVPVRIDPDRHPAVARRFAAAGCPSLSILRANGDEIVRATDMRRANVAVLLRRIHEHLQKRPEVVDKELQEARRATDRMVAHKLNLKAVETAIMQTYDARFGGFGGPGKFPETQVLALLQELAQTRNDKAAQAMVNRTVDALLASPLWDGAPNDLQGLLAQSHTTDWRMPRFEAHAADQAGMLVLLGQLAPDNHNYKRAGQRLFDAIGTHWFDDKADAFRARRSSETQVDSLGGYATWVDTLVLADANALLIRACLQAGAALDRRQPAIDMAVHAATTLQTRFISSEGAVRHAAEPGAPLGLLRDQMQVAMALQETAAQTGRQDLAETAQRVRHWADAHLWDGVRGTYIDARPDPPEVWFDLPDDSDDRAPSGLAAAAEAALAAADTARAERILRHGTLSAPPGRRHASMARQLLRLLP